jgi:hypothetical protein
MRKKLEIIKKEIDPDGWYKPRTIAENGWIVAPNRKGKSWIGSYAYILKLIKAGKIKAKNWGLGQTPYYRINGREILKFLEEYSGN